MIQTTTPIFTYCDWTNKDLKYAKWTGATWSIQTVDSVGHVGIYTSIGLEPDAIISGEQPSKKMEQKKVLNIKTFEYNITQHKIIGIVNIKITSDLLAEINMIAEQGWELVNVVPYNINAGATERIICFWKKEK